MPGSVPPPESSWFRSSYAQPLTVTPVSTVTTPENSDVPCPASVAVAVRRTPEATPPGAAIVKRKRLVSSVPCGIPFTGEG